LVDSTVSGRENTLQAVRIQRHLMAIGTSFMVLALAALCWRQGILDAAPFLQASSAIVFFTLL
jgi:hypothetical protein